MADDITHIDDDVKPLSMPFDEAYVLSEAFSNFDQFSPHQQQQVTGDFNFHHDELGGLEDFLDPLPAVAVHDPPANSYLEANQNIVNTPPAADQLSIFSVLSPDPHVADKGTDSHPKVTLKLGGSAIRKPAARRRKTLIDSLVLQAKQQQQLLPAPSSNASVDTVPAASSNQFPGMVPSSTPSIRPPTRNPETRRLEHNLMMRQNRERTNGKFKDLALLLEYLSTPQTASLLMRNKMQVLDRAMVQYPAMQAQKSGLRAELILATCTPSTTITDSIANNMTGLPEALGTSLVPACETVAKLAFGKQGWKYAEIHVRRQGFDSFILRTALLSPGNMLSTCEKLKSFSKRPASIANCTQRYVHAAARLRVSVWAPNLGQSSDTNGCHSTAAFGAVSTALFVPVVLGQCDGMADAVIALYHADDEILSFPDGLRPYKPDVVAQVEDLVQAIRANPRMAVV